MDDDDEEDGDVDVDDDVNWYAYWINWTKRIRWCSQ